MAVFYKKNLNSVILTIISMKKGPDEFKPLFKKYRRFKPLFQEELEKEALSKH
jgi:hypothetical protein